MDREKEKEWTIGQARSDGWILVARATTDIVGNYVLAMKADDNGKYRYVSWFENCQDGGTNGGHYSDDINFAVEAFKRRVANNAHYLKNNIIEMQSEIDEKKN